MFSLIRTQAVVFARGFGGRFSPEERTAGRLKHLDVEREEKLELMLNDDYTPMEFLIEQFFDMDRESAMRLMLRVHNEGIAECGTYSYEIAKAKVTQVDAFAGEHRHPLQCVIERKR
jgi:ATP-dependent Clp protease adaptor protein ClpS